MRDLLVTSSDGNYLEQARQLFSSAYHNGGWQGDYMLLAHEVPEVDVAWFRERGILVKHCETLLEKTIGGRPPVLADRIHLFSDEFRQWRSVLFTDADVIIRGSLESLKDRSGFYSVRDWNPYLRLQVLPEQEIAPRRLSSEHYRVLCSELSLSYNLRAPAFCAGFFFFTTDLIEEKSFERLKNLLDRYESISRFGEQLIMNLAFHGVWRQLPDAYNMMLYKSKPQWPLSARHVDALMLHFVGPEKPWDSTGPFREEWDAMLQRADEFELENIPAGNVWSAEKIQSVSAVHRRWLSISRFIKRYADVAALSQRWNRRRG